MIFKKGELKIYLPFELNLNQEVNFRIEYVYDLQKVKKISKIKNIWMRYDSSWYPVTKCLQNSTYELQANVPNNYRVITHGDLVNIKEHGSSKTYNWKEDNLISRFALVIGKYYVKEKIYSELKISIYYYSDTSGINLDKYCDKAKHIIYFFNEILLKYRYKYLKIIEISDDFPCSYSNDSIILLSNMCFISFCEDTLVHEIIHQWFGNRIIFIDDEYEIFCESVVEFFCLLYFEEIYRKKEITNFIKCLSKLEGKKYNKSIKLKNIIKKKIQYISFLLYIKEFLGNYKFKILFRKIVAENTNNIIHADNFMSQIREKAEILANRTFHQKFAKK